MRIVENDQETYEGGLKIIYGPPGCGKTKLVMALMKLVYKNSGMRSLYLDREKSWISAPSEMRKGGFVDRVNILTTKSVERKSKDGATKTRTVVSDPIDDMFEFAHMAVEGNYGVVVVDTISTVGADILASIVSKDTSGSRKGTTRVNVETDGGKQINHPTQADYGVFASVMEEWLRRIWPAVEAGSFVVLIGHQKKFEEVDEATGAVEDSIGTIEMPGRQVPLSLPKFADLILRLTKRKKKRSERGADGRMIDFVFFSEGDGVWIAKDRLSVFDPRGEVWTVPREEFSGAEEHSQAVSEIAEGIWLDYLGRFKAVQGKKGGSKK
jgi:energy-coupling factor transporter ATP-binding protein EcfA2